MNIKTLPNIDLKHYTEQQILKAFFVAAKTHQSSIAIWRLPHAREVQLIVSFLSQFPKRAVDLNSKLPGFVISPFLNPKGDQTLFIPAHLYYHRNQVVEIPSPHEDQKKAFLKTLFEAKVFLEKLLPRMSLLGTGHLAPETSHYVCSNPDAGTPSPKTSFITIVKKGIEAIKKGEFHKVVLARTSLIDLNQQFDLINTFKVLEKDCPDRFVFLVSTPNYGTWMGATPELLFKVDQDLILHTVALAGTKPAGSAEAAWTQKEIEEQALVSHFIIKQFKKLGVQEWDEFGPKTVTAGNVAHLKTEFKVDLKAYHSPQFFGNALLLHLHPTSAVCGMPKKSALNFIKKYESFDRVFYCGYLGSVNIHEETCFYVNIRCMQLLENQAILYAGAGITRDSDPVKEWEETNLKCQMLMKFLRN
jgi:isochorismate synthase